MKKTEAIITPSKLDDVRSALAGIGVPRLTVNHQPLTAMLKIDVVVADELTVAVVKTIERAGRTGETKRTI